MAKKEQKSAKLSFAEFTRKAVIALREGKKTKKGEPMKCIYGAASKFNEAARIYFNWDTPTLMDELQKLAKESVIVTRSASGGPCIFLKEDAVALGIEQPKTLEDTLAAILA